MKIAVFGNNLNAGYNLVKYLRAAGVEAILLLPDYQYQQEYQQWWTEQPIKEDWIVRFADPQRHLYAPGRLLDQSEIRSIYAVAQRFDALLMAEYGPALFSELEGVIKIFISYGADLQILPFMIRTHLSPIPLFANSLNRLRAGHWLAPLGAIRHFAKYYLPYRNYQERQRRGLQQSERLILAPYQLTLVAELGLEAARAIFIPALPDPQIYEEVDPKLTADLKSKYRDVDILFFHPTRQFYLKLNANSYLKDNDKLLYGFARYIETTHRRVQLVLVEKGRAQDIANSKRLVGELGIAPYTEWIPELPNKMMRSYYLLDQVVICDQYSPRLATLGSIGRETSYFGRPLITAFDPELNRRWYEDDQPAHILPATSADEICRAMTVIDSFGRDDFQNLAAAAHAWFARQLSPNHLIERYIELVEQVMGQNIPSA